MFAQINARTRLRPDDPGDIGDVGKRELRANEVGARREGAIQLRELGFERLRSLPVEDDSVIRLGKLIEALEPKAERVRARPALGGGAEALDSSPPGIP